MQKLVEKAGLGFVKCEAYYTEWLYPGLDDIVDFFLSIFNFERNVSESEKDAFRKTWRDMLEHETTVTSSGWKLKFRLVAVDSCPRIIEYARERTWHPEIFYDVLDIERSDDVTRFIEKYGTFERVYSFMCFHFVKDQQAAYRNVRRLLAENGECVVVSCVSTQLTDVWLQVHETQKWKSYVPDPKEIFSSHFRFNCVTPARQIEDETTRLLTEARLHCVRCEVYENEWTFPDIDTIIHFFFAIFGSEEVVPDSEKEAFKNVWRTILEKKTQERPEGGSSVEVPHFGGTRVASPADGQCSVI
ncbi:hypothetical protein MTO96_048018 [Rhipicephalus appendiculatus]